MLNETCTPGFDSLNSSNNTTPVISITCLQCSLNTSARTLSQDMFPIWYSTRMAVPILYHLLFGALFHPVLICFSTNKIPTSNFIIFIYLYLEFSVLCSVFLETWSSFDIIATIRFLEVLCATIAVVIALRAALISFFLYFPNAKSAVVTFSTTFSHAFLFLTSLKPNNFVARLIFFVFYQSM